jgi:glycosyltransferase involved in cell wall biosynthesis
MSIITAKKQKRALVLAPFFSTEMNASRPFLVACVLATLSAVDVITTNFDHNAKKRKEAYQVTEFNEIVYLKTWPYRSNISVLRLLSHLEFSGRAALYFLKHRNRYDIVYVSLPFNVLGWFILSSAGRQHKIADVIDVWPDVLPFPPWVKSVLAPFFVVWKWFFKAAIFRADVVMAVSDEFMNEASLYANQAAQTKRFYIGHDQLSSTVSKQLIFTIAYVGNLGYLYDFDTLVEVLTEDELRASIQLFVIGKGNRQEWLLSELQRRGIRHKFFGAVYDIVQLADILRSCHVGFNGYINTSAAFSYKATTYFAAGLPIINSMKGDLQQLVKEHKLGENYKAGDYSDLRTCILRFMQNGITDMTANCERFFSSHLELCKISADMRAYFVTKLN